jgi:4,5-dihydroxyphthalate decarboxylase
VPEYQQTAALWARGALQHSFGVAPQELDWYMERTEELSHGGAVDFRPPPGLRFQRIPPGTTLAAMLVAGELDAALVYVPDPNFIDRSGPELTRHPRVRGLFPDAAAEGARYYRETGIFPMSHVIVVRRGVVDAQPWVALNLYKAFVAAKERQAARLRALSESYFTLGLLSAETRGVLATDLYPYGVQANRKVLETVAAYSHEQGLTDRAIGLDEVFAASTLDL